MRLLFVVIVIVMAVVLYLYTLFLLIALSSCFDCLFVLFESILYAICYDVDDDGLKKTEAEALP